MLILSIDRHIKEELGGIFSVALSVSMPHGMAARVYPSRVTRHRALRSSDFPPPAFTESDPPPFQNRMVTLNWNSLENKEKEIPLHEKNGKIGNRLLTAVWIPEAARQNYQTIGKSSLIVKCLVFIVLASALLFLLKRRR